MATVAPQSVATAGTAVTYASATTGGDTITNALGTTFVVKNGSGSSITVTFAGVVDCNLGETHDKAFTVAASGEEHIPVPGHCVDPDTGSAGVTYSSATTVTVAAIK